MRFLLIKASCPKRYNLAFPPVGLLYLAGALKKAGYSEVRLLHMDLCKNPHQALAEELATFRPDVVGISAITAEAISLHKIAAQIATFVPKPFIIAGGAYPTSCPDECLNSGNIDAVVRNEGEETLVELVSALEKGRGLENIRGVSYIGQGVPRHNPNRPFIEDLDSLPMPDWSLTDFDRDKAFYPQSGLLYVQTHMSIMTSRGCPYHCTFCHNMFGKHFRAHSPERVLSELKTLREAYGIREIEIIDDIFNLDKERAAEIMRRIRDELPGTKLFFGNGLRGDILTRELIDLFAQAGVKSVSIAVETASPDLQKRVHKNIDLPKLSENIHYLVHKRIYTNGFFMMGFPDETPAELMETIKLIWRLPIHNFILSPCMVYPGARLAKTLHMDKKTPLLNNMTARASVTGGAFCSTLNPRLLPLIKIVAIFVFYFCFPVRVYRILRDMPF